ncbi:MAG: DUF3857 domain-containing protein [Lutibacter sp.]|uniref:DUF3857 domain-containing protein n=1 Tax=Lutibacter sp. TaxID=1925666 RepID=UPI00385AD138
MKKIVFTLVILMVNQLFSQNYKFGKVSKEELKEEYYPLDSSANAAVLYKKRKTFFNYVQGEGFMIVTEIHERIKIYNSEGYEWATKQIKYYTPKGSKPEKVNKIEAKTYVFENGKIESYKLKKNDIYKEILSKYWSEKKFSMPNIDEGCIVEWKYTVTSPYKGIDKVKMQYNIPIKKFQCKVEIPEYYKYNVKQTGYLSMNLSSTVENKKIVLRDKTRSDGFRAPAATSFRSQDINFTTNVTTIEKDNMPALFEESYVNNINNYSAGVQYELSSIKMPNDIIKYYSQSWEDVAKTIYKAEEFGRELNKSNYFKDDLELILKKYSGQEQVVLAIFNFVKQKVKWNNYKGIFTDKGVKKAYKSGSGNTADINLMLISMLREAKINAHPIILSTRDQGIPIFPTIDGFNYVIAAVEMEKGIVLLDATEQSSTPNVLPLRDLNWRGRIIKDDNTSDWVNLIPAKPSLENTTINITIDEEGYIEGMQRTSYTDLFALNYRNKYSKLNKETSIERVEEKNEAIEIIDFRLTNKDKIEKPAIEIFKFSSEDLIDVIDNKMYFKPLLFKSIIENPFKLEKREYPIDFGTPFKENTSINYTIPEGYTIESIPESIAIGLSDNLGVFRFMIKVANNKINVRSILEINTAIFPALNYQEIKEFYKVMVNKNLEKIVLKKL